MLDVVWLGRLCYSDGLGLQRRLLAERKSGTLRDIVLLLEHEHVYTLGRRSTSDDIYLESDVLASMGVDVVETDRGGEATYHGPGQLIAYPILSIREAGMGPVAYVRILEEAIIRTLAEFGVRGHRVVGKTGVWVGGEPGSKPMHGALPKGRKIAAIGVRVSGGVAMHGMALNISTDLGYYEHITPCGMPGLRTTSLEREIGKSHSPRSVGEVWAERFADVLMRELEWLDESSWHELRSDRASASV